MSFVDTTMPKRDYHVPRDRTGEPPANDTIDPNAGKVHLSEAQPWGRGTCHI